MVFGDRNELKSFKLVGLLNVKAANRIYGQIRTLYTDFIISLILKFVVICSDITGEEAEYLIKRKYDILFHISILKS